MDPRIGWGTVVHDALLEECHTGIMDILDFLLPVIFLKCR